MLKDRSIPQSTVIPDLAYPDVGEAADWLCRAFGFTVRIRIGNHRAQLNVGDGTVIVTELRVGDEFDPSRAADSPRRMENAHSVLVRVNDIDAHHDRAAQHGARILRPPADYPYGERQYSAEDFAGYRWDFSQSIADVAPEDWGGTPGNL